MVHGQRVKSRVLRDKMRLRSPKLTCVRWAPKPIDVLNTFGQPQEKRTNSAATNWMGSEDEDFGTHQSKN